MSQIQAIATADSNSAIGYHRIYSPVVTFPRIVLAELNTHRILSRNTASSRAMSTKKMMQSIIDNPFIPVAWQKEHTGMQGTEYITDPEEIEIEVNNWLEDMRYALASAERRMSRKVTKQIINRQLEPYMWVTALLSGTEWENFFNLRCPQYCPYEDRSIRYRSRKDLLAKETHFVDLKEDATIIDWLNINEGKAEIHMSLLAEAIWDNMKESKPKQLKEGQWHIVYDDKINAQALWEEAVSYTNKHNCTMDLEIVWRIKVATAMAARTSYTVVGDEKELSYGRLLDIYTDKLLPRIDEPFHASPFEHCSRSMFEREYFEYSKSYSTNILTKDMEEEKQAGYTMITPANPKYNRGLKYKVTEFGWCRNVRGFIPLRHIIESGGTI